MLKLPKLSKRNEFFFLIQSNGQKLTSLGIGWSECNNFILLIYFVCKYLRAHPLKFLTSWFNWFNELSYIRDFLYVWSHLFYYSSLLGDKASFIQFCRQTTFLSLYLLVCDVRIHDLAKIHLFANLALPITFHCPQLSHWILVIDY